MFRNLFSGTIILIDIFHELKSNVTIASRTIYTECFLPKQQLILPLPCTFVVNGQCPDAQEIDADIPDSSLNGPTIFLFHINDLTKNIIRLLMNIYADDTAVYR